MPDPRYIFGGDTELTPEDLKKRRDIAQLMMQPGAAAPANVGEGIYDASRKIAGALMAKKLDAQSLEMAKKAEAEAMAASMGMDATNAAGSSAFDAFFGGSSGGFDYMAPPQQPWQPTAGVMSEVFANARPNPGLGYSGVSKINANNPFAIPGGFQV